MSKCQPPEVEFTGTTASIYNQMAIHVNFEKCPCGHRYGEHEYSWQWGQPMNIRECPRCILEEK